VSTRKEVWGDRINEDIPFFNLEFMDSSHRDKMSMHTQIIEN